MNFDFSEGNSISGLILSWLSQSFPGLSESGILKFRHVFAVIMVRMVGNIRYCNSIDDPHRPTHR